LGARRRRRDARDGKDDEFCGCCAFSCDGHGAVFFDAADDDEEGWGWRRGFDGNAV